MRSATQVDDALLAAGGDLVVVGRAGVVYDLWGAAVQLASKMRRGSAQPGVYVSQDVYEATRDTLRYTSAGSIQVGDRQEATWRLAEDRS